MLLTISRFCGIILREGEKMDELLTARQVQDLLRIDRTTLYRMVADGRLPGFKVGGRWRFSREAVEDLLRMGASQRPREVGLEGIRETATILPLFCVIPLQNVFAEAMGVGVVTTTVEGEPLTPMSNSCAFCNLILTSPEGRRRCVASWRALGQVSEKKPQLYCCHAGLRYARGRIEVGNEFVAMIIAGQILTEPFSDAQWSERISDVARACALSPDTLWAARETVRVLHPTAAEHLMHLLGMAAETIAHIGQERADLLSRLQRIAAISRLKDSEE